MQKFRLRETSRGPSNSQKNAPVKKSKPKKRLRALRQKTKNAPRKPPSERLRTRDAKPKPRPNAPQRKKPD